MRKAGILLAVCSLPSKHGIGDFGPSAFEWVDLLKESNVKIWQILPLNPLGYGNSPYQPYSSYAMDDLYNSLEVLKKEKLIKNSKLDYDLLEKEILTLAQVAAEYNGAYKGWAAKVDE